MTSSCRKYASIAESMKTWSVIRQLNAEVVYDDHNQDAGDCPELHGTRLPLSHYK